MKQRPGFRKASSTAAAQAIDVTLRCRSLRSGGQISMLGRAECRSWFSARANSLCGPPREMDSMIDRIRNGLVWHVVSTACGSQEVTAMAKLMATVFGVAVTAVMFLSLGACGEKSPPTRRAFRPRQRTSDDTDIA